jgi:putative methionine-R-sulfoxide reductase with GAF domain
LAVPIKLRDEILGILDVQSDVTGALTAEDQLLLRAYAGKLPWRLKARSCYLPPAPSAK